MPGLLRSFDGGHRERVSCIAISNDRRRLLSGSRSDADGVNLWNFDTGELLHTFPLEVNDATNAVAFSADGGFAAAATSGHKIILWNLETLAQLGSVPTTSTEGAGIGFAPANEFILSANGRRYTRYDFAVAEIQEHDKLQNGRLLSMSFPATGRFAASTHVASAGSPDVMVWDLVNDNLFLEFRGGPGGAHTAAAFSHFGNRLLLGDLKGRITLINTQSGTEGVGNPIRVFDAPSASVPPPRPRAVHCVAASSDVRIAASGDDDPFLRVWDVETGKELSGFPTGDTGVTAIAFAPDSRLAVTASGPSPKAWDLS